MKTLFLLITILLTNDGVFAANTPLVIYRIPLDFCGGSTTLVKSRMVLLDNPNDYSEATAIDYDEYNRLITSAKKRWHIQQKITDIRLAFVVYDTDKQQKRYFVACGNRLIDFSNMVEYHFKTPDSQKLLKAFIENNTDTTGISKSLVIYRIPLEFYGGTTTKVLSRMVSLDNSNDYSEADAIDYNEFEILVFAKKRWPFQQIIITGIELAFVVYDTDKQQKWYFVACGNRLINLSNKVEYRFKTPDSQKLLKAFIENNID